MAVSRRIRDAIRSVSSINFINIAGKRPIYRCIQNDRLYILARIEVVRIRREGFVGAVTLGQWWLEFLADSSIVPAHRPVRPRIDREKIR